MTRFLAASFRDQWRAGGLILFTVSAFAWVLLVLADKGLIAPSLCSAHLSDALAVSATIDFLLRTLSPTSLLASMMLMTVAMMLPLQTPAISHLRTKSLAERRHRALGVYLVVYASVWALALTVARVAVIAVGVSIHGPLPGALLAAGAALLWQGSIWRDRALVRCHAFRPIRIQGLAADLDCARMGLRSAMRCIGSCGGYMAVMLAAGSWHLLLSIGAMLVAMIERCLPPRAPTNRPVIQLLGVACLALAARGLR